MNPGIERSPTIKRYSSIGRLNDWVERMGLDHYSFVNAYAKAGDFKAYHINPNFLIATIALHSGAVVALGLEVSKILVRLGIPHFVMPHPSYRNRKLNDKLYEDRMIDWCRQYIDIKHEPAMESE